MNPRTRAAFFDELEKVALTEAFFKSPMAKQMIGTWNSAKNLVQRGQGAIMRRAPLKPIPKLAPMASTQAGVFPAAMSGRAQFLMDKHRTLLDEMRKRVKPALTSPQVAAAAQAERAARAGQLRGRVIL